MRAASRLLAAVKQGKFLEPGAPTGLTGLYTHPTPRASLIYLYNSTLDKLQKIPESSVYRKSTEALTKHRLAIVEAAKPEGLEAWRERMKKKMEEVEQSLQDDPTELQKFQAALKAGRMISFQSVFRREEDERDVEWNGEPKGPFIREGPVSSKERELVFEPEGKPIDPTTGEEFGARSSHVIEPEPSLTAEQIAELEQKIGAGLIEEVIQVAEGEHELVDKMIEAKIWEELCETPVEGQWTYFERGTQKP